MKKVLSKCMKNEEMMALKVLGWMINQPILQITDLKQAIKIMFEI